MLSADSPTRTSRNTLVVGKVERLVGLSLGHLAIDLGVAEVLGDSALDVSLVEEETPP